MIVLLGTTVLLELQEQIIESNALPEHMQMTSILEMCNNVFPVLLDITALLEQQLLLYNVWLDFTVQ